MRCISWNCRGLGNPSAVRALKKLLRAKNPDIVFLMKTSITKLHYTLDQLHRWSRDKFGDVPSKIRMLQNTLEALKKGIPTKDCILKIKQLEVDLDDLLKQEELWWAQRAKVHWLKHGDLNTKYFHHKASQRKRKNYISNIQDQSGNFWQDSNKIHSIFSNHFQNIFSSSHYNDNSNVYEAVKNRVNS